MEKAGITLSLTWLSIMGCLLFLKWESALELTLNEWGDFLAGMMAPIAFLWLIIGYGLQRKELKANTDALLFQRDEMANQAKELTEQTRFLEMSAKAVTSQAREIKTQNRREQISKWRDKPGTPRVKELHGNGDNDK